MFSMLQTMMQLPARSRSTSYSSSFQPEQRRLDERLMDQRRFETRSASVARSSASSYTTPPPVPPSVYAGRTTSG